MSYLILAISALFIAITGGFVGAWSYDRIVNQTWRKYVNRVHVDVGDR